MCPLYNPSCSLVNARSCVRQNNIGCSVATMELRHRIKRARGHADLTQDQLAEKVRQMSGGERFSQQALSKLERGESEETRYLPWIAKACGVRTDWLAFEEEPMSRGDVAALDARLSGLLGRLPAPQRERIAALVETMVTGSSGS